MLNAIFFDLDGTLLPLDNDTFTKVYFNELAKTAYTWGYTDPDALIKGVWYGVKCMYRNDGTLKNEEVFWKSFSEAMGRDCSEDQKRFDSFYRKEFSKVSAATLPAPLAREVIKTAHEKAKKVILATNPIFPKEAYEERLSWIGLEASDFDMITDYSISHFTKPSPLYYREIMRHFDLSPEEVLMFGNDVREDMIPALSLGMKFFLQNEYVLNKDEAEITTPQGNYEEMLQFLKNLP